MRPKSAGIAALSALLAVAAAPATAGAGRAMELGIQDGSLAAGNPPVQPAPLLDALGIQRERILVPWRTVERRPGAFDASRWVRAAAAARARDHRVSIVLAGPAPPWAARGAGGYRYPDPGRYAAFAGAAARQLAPYVARYSVWDEPNRAGRLAPQRSAARQYAALFSAGAAAIRAADPGSEVLFGELQPGTRGAAFGRTPLAFLREAFCTGRRWRARCNRGLAADGVALHPAAPSRRRGRDAAPGAVTMERLGAFGAALDRLARGGGLTAMGGGSMGLHLTAYSCRAARRLDEAYSIALHNRRVREIVHSGLFLSPGPPAGSSALVTRSGRRTACFRSLAAWVRRHR